MAWVAAAILMTAVACLNYRYAVNPDAFDVLIDNLDKPSLKELFAGQLHAKLTIHKLYILSSAIVGMFALFNIGLLAAYSRQQKKDK